ncbi:MAG: hypothetical protein ACPIOQ_68805, partial [Promethearchaeia archaeon]
VHVHPEGVAAWCDISPNGEKCATANDAVFDTYWAAEHEVSKDSGACCRHMSGRHRLLRPSLNLQCRFKWRG